MFSHLAYQGTLLQQEPLRRYTTWRVGGPADWLYIPASVADLQQFLAQIAPYQLPITWLGLGSNVLIRDDGIKGVVIYTQGGLSALSLHNIGEVCAQAGVPCAKVAKFAARQGLIGAEFLVGIPGTMGGALAMNAGAFGGETWPIVNRVEVINRHGEIILRNASDFVPSYRQVQGLQADEWFSAAYLQLQAGDSAWAEDNIKLLLKKRNASQPIGEPSCGSVFRNPAGDYAARLIEQCGLKGKIIGQARVSLKHANFIVHDGGARASDIEQLIEEVRKTVFEQQGILLESEVKILGDTV